MSVIELSHRSAEYEAVHDEALALTREVGRVPDDFEILFVQGGATLQFAMVPLNLLPADAQAGYVVSGSWGKRALEDAGPHGQVYEAWDGKGDSYTRMPRPEEVVVRGGTRYLHITTNETIGGIRMSELPATDVPLVADMSSEYLARPIAWDRYDLVYGGVQKNLAPAGLAVVIVRRSALDDANQHLGSFLRYRWHAENKSLGHTPAMFPIYLMGKVLKLMKEQGGVEALQAASAQKAGLVYQAIDQSEGFYLSPVQPADRSHMNVVFRLSDEGLEGEFLEEAEERGLIGLKGHRSVGGLRASLYAALSMESVQALTGFMEEFRQARQ